MSQTRVRLPYVPPTLLSSVMVARWFLGPLSQGSNPWGAAILNVRPLRLMVRTLVSQVSNTSSNLVGVTLKS